MTTAQRTLRAAGLLAGMALAALLLLAVRVPDSSGVLGAGVRLSAVPPGDLRVPSEPFLVARNLVSGGSSARGRLRVRNISAGPLRVRLRLRPEEPLLDRGLNVRLMVGERTLAVGSLGSLRRWSDPALVGESEALALRAVAWVPAAAEDYQGRSVDVPLEFRARPVGGSR
jgi:hypothetical protein